MNLSLEIEFFWKSWIKWAVGPVPFYDPNTTTPRIKNCTESIKNAIIDTHYCLTKKNVTLRTIKISSDSHEQEDNEFNHSITQ